MCGRRQWLELGSGRGDKCLKIGQHQMRLCQRGGMWGQLVPEYKAAAGRERLACALQSGPSVAINHLWDLGSVI